MADIAPATFGDMEDTFLTSEVLGDTAEEPVKESAPPAQLPPPPQPVFFQPNNNTFEQLAAFDQAKRAQEAQEKSVQAWDQQFNPPPPPPDKDRLLADPEALTKYVGEQGQWAANSFRTMQAAFAQAIQMQAAQMSASTQQVLTPVLHRAAEEAMNQAVDQLRQGGYDQIEAIVPQVEQALRQRPDTYWQMRTDPRALAWALKISAEQQGVQPRAGNRPQAPSGVPRSIGYNGPAHPTRETPAGNIAPEVLAMTQRMFPGLRITKDVVAKFPLLDMRRRANG